MDDGLDYDVATKITFWLNFMGGSDLNDFAYPAVYRAFTDHVKEVFLADDILKNYITSNLDFHFDGRKCCLEYTFSCHDESEAEAESFSEYCVQRVQEELEKFGCRLSRINCSAQEADMTWLDELEDAIFDPRQAEQEDAAQSQQGMGGMAL